MNTCIISGGGPKGSFAVGVLKALHGRGLRFDHYLGTSTGALITPFAALDRLDFLEETYLNVLPKDIYGKRKWWQLPFSPGLYNMKPMRSIIEKNLSQLDWESLEAKVDITLFNLNTGQVEYWNPTATKTRDEWISAMVASASIPIVSDPVTIRGDRYVDGGVRDIAPLDGLPIDAKAVVITMGSPIERKERIRGVHEIAARVIEGMTDEMLKNDMHVINELDKVESNKPSRFVHIPLKTVYVKGQKWTKEDMQKQFSHGYREGMDANLEVFGL